MEERTVVEGRACHCGGSILETITKRKMSWFGPPVYGPGEKGRFLEIKSYHCEECGLVYVPNKEGLVGLTKRVFSRKSRIWDTELASRENDR